MDIHFILFSGKLWSKLEYKSELLTFSRINFYATLLGFLALWQDIEESFLVYHYFFLKTTLNGSKYIRKMTDEI